MGKVFGFLMIAFVGIFAICSCKVASWSDQETEGGFEKWKSKGKS